jgi:hypothetical protein
MRHPSRAIALALLAGALTLPLTACTQVEESESSYVPTSVTAVKGTKEVKQVTFTAEAVRRADVHTDVVRRLARRTFIPYAALIYDEHGDTWTYVTAKPRVYLRTRIHVHRISGDRVILRAGPPPGTKVVTTGAAEVYSAEFGVEE